MSIGTRNSTIERFRIRNHGNNRLRFLRVSNDSQHFLLTAEIARGFLLMRLGEADINGIEARLTLDLIYNEGIDPEAILDSSFVDYWNPETDAFQRWRIRSDGTPQVDEDRFVLGLYSAFSDIRDIT